MGLDTHIIAGNRACPTFQPGPPTPSITNQTSPHYAEALRLRQAGRPELVQLTAEAATYALLGLVSATAVAHAGFWQTRATPPDRRAHRRARYNRLRRALRSTLPTGVRGRSSRTWTSRGYL